MRRYEKHHIDYVKSIAEGRYNDEIREMFNSKFGFNVTKKAISSLKKNHGIVSNVKKAKPGSQKKLFTDEQEAFVKENVKGLGNEELAELVNSKFDTHYTTQQVKALKHRRGWSSELTGYYEKGQEPWNKGMKGLVFPGSEKGWFKKGGTPSNYRPVGSERIDKKDGYVLIKVQDEGTWPERWRHKHVVTWENEYGEVPENYVVAFLDSNKTNLSLDNLVLLHRSELKDMNRYGYFSKDPEVTLARITLVRLQGRILELDLMGGDKEKFKEYAKKAERNGISYDTFKARIRRGWGINNAITLPLHTRGLKREKAQIH